jgi:hypothetical protein
MKSFNILIQSRVEITRIQLIQVNISQLSFSLLPKGEDVFFQKL